MSIAVRAGIIGLTICVCIVGLIAGWAILQRQSLLGQNQNLQRQINDDQSKLTDLTAQTQKLQSDADQINSKLTEAENEKRQAQSQLDDLKQKSDDLQAQITQANTDRDDWKNRVGTITQERDDLMQKFRQRPVKIVYKDRIVKESVDNSGNTATAAVPDVTSGQGDQYWAGVLRQKAALQVELEQEKSVLDQAALQVIELKKQNSDLQLQVGQLSNEKDEIIQKIKYGQDLADNLSIDLARSRNDQKAVSDRADKVQAENMELQDQIRGLSSTKLELEKNVERLTDEKDSMQKKLVETESIIQNRIDDIWKIKESLDKKLSENSPSAVPSASSSSEGGMELPPIIVNPSNNQQQAPSTPAVGKTEGSIISINESNNFVIVDLGQENSSVSIGNTLKVYRDSQNVATLQVIQVRRDICAADIKFKSDELKVGDVVRFN